jgi:uncharacterized protein (TIGR00251 family)
MIGIFSVHMTSFKDAIIASKQGVLLRLHVIPGSSQTVFPVSYNQWRHTFEMKVRSEAKENKANAEVLETVARFFNLKEKDVVLISGEKNREKTVCLKNISSTAVEGKLKENLDG